MAGMSVYPSAGNSTFINENGMGEGGYNAISTVATTGINIWGSLAVADENAQMQTSLYNYNNSMRALLQGVKQYAADKNRAAAADAKAATDLQIDQDQMKAQGQAATTAAMIGSSGSAKRAVMYDINRNAVAARQIQSDKFEHTLQQVQLSEYGSEVQSIQSYQNPNTVQGADPLAAVAKGVLDLSNKSIKSGAWDKGGALRTTFSDLFTNTEAKLPTGD